LKNVQNFNLTVPRRAVTRDRRKAAEGPRGLGRGRVWSAREETRRAGPGAVGAPTSRNLSISFLGSALQMHSFCPLMPIDNVKRSLFLQMTTI